ncbi:MAG: hypothetical protein ACFCVK_09655 [Acidimicrobiales bacterium]
MNKDDELFRVVRRGYDTGEVDRHVSALEEQLVEANRLNEKLSSRVAELEWASGDVERQREAAAEEGAAAARAREELLAATDAEIAERRAAADAEMAELQSTTETDIAERRAKVELDLIELRAAAEQEIRARRSTADAAIAERRSQADAEALAQARVVLAEQEEALDRRQTELDERFESARVDYDRVLMRLNGKVMELEETHRTLVGALRAIARGGLQSLEAETESLPPVPLPVPVTALTHPVTVKGSGGDVELADAG